MTKSKNKNIFKGDIECQRSRETEYRRSDRRRGKKAHSLKYKHVRAKSKPYLNSEVIKKTHKRTTSHRAYRDDAPRAIENLEKGCFTLKCIVKWVFRYIIATVLLAALMMGALWISVQIKAKKSIKSDPPP